jgi:flagellar protein FliO/FliZ
MSTIVRTTLAIALLASVAHAQTATQYDRRTPAEPNRLLQPPPAQAIGQQRSLPTKPNVAVQPVSRIESVTPSGASDEPLRIQKSNDSQRLQPDSSAAKSGGNATATVLGSLAVVLAAFFVLVWISRKTAPKGLAPLPSEVFESLGRAPLTARQQMQLVRLGNKLVLLSVTPTGAESLTEITDVDEVNRLTGLCQQNKSGSISESFRDVLSQYAEEPAPGGFTGDPAISQTDIANRTTRRQRREANRA